MSINSMIITALSGIVDAVPDESTEHAAMYATFGYDEIGDSHGDDEPQATRYLCELHFYAPITENTLTVRNAIKAAIHSAGFTAPDVFNLAGQDRYADPSKRQHYLYEFEYAGEPNP